jgi:hypothetical protein
MRVLLGLQLWPLEYLSRGVKGCLTHLVYLVLCFSSAYFSCDLGIVLTQ